MKSVCAWCEAEGKVSVREYYDRGEPVTHGICEDHSKSLLASIGQARGKMGLAEGLT